MKTFKVLGEEPVKCASTAKLITQIAQEQDMDIVVEKITGMAAMMEYGIKSTLGVVLNDKVIYTGNVPNAAQIMDWLSARD